MDKTLLKVLESIGFSEKEARIYAALTELGRGTVAQIAKKAELKRPIVYVVLGGLMAHGYASEIPNTKVNTYQATDATIILRNMQTSVKNLSDFIPVLRTLSNKGGRRPHITYFDNKESLKKVYEEMNYEEEPFFVTSYVRLEETFPGIIDDWVSGYKKGRYKKLRGFHIVSDDLKEIEIVKVFKTVNQRVRILSELRRSSMDFTLYGKKLALSYLGENPFCVVIESEGLVASLRPIFDIVWEKAQEI